MKEFSDIINQAKEWMRKYSPDILLKWIQTCSIYPSNQKYQLRFELLLATILSFKVDEFSYEKLEYDDFKAFIMEFKNKTDHISY